MGSPSTSRTSPRGSSQSVSQQSSFSRSVLRRQVLPSYRTKPCMFEPEGRCLWGEDCSYIHRSQSAVPVVLASPYTRPLYPSAETTAPSSTLEDKILQHPSNISLSADGLSAAPPPTPDISAIGHALHTLSLSDSGIQQRRRYPARTCHYRTKPCRFYRDTGRCAKGDRCDFIHDASMIFGSAETETESSVGLPDSASESGSTSPAHWVHSQLTEEKSNRSLNGTPERSNYYPITWRIIGGGVMMSGSREICQDYMAGYCPEGIDCKFSHPAAADEQEPVAISEFRASQFYTTSFSPSTSVQLLPVPVFVRPPPRRHPRRGPQQRKITRSRQDGEHLLNGSTLLPMRIPQDTQASDPPSNEESTSTSTSPTPPSSQLFPTRPIERPASTPPSDITSFAKVLRILPAESPL